MSYLPQRQVGNLDENMKKTAKTVQCIPHNIDAAGIVTQLVGASAAML